MPTTCTSASMACIATSSGVANSGPTSTSKPMSANAEAMTLAPRSWPSCPILATRMRGRRPCCEEHTAAWRINTRRAVNPSLPKHMLWSLICLRLEVGRERDGRVDLVGVAAILVNVRTARQVEGRRVPPPLTLERIGDLADRGLGACRVHRDANNALSKDALQSLRRGSDGHGVSRAGLRAASIASPIRLPPSLLSHALAESVSARRVAVTRVSSRDARSVSSFASCASMTAWLSMVRMSGSGCSRPAAGLNLFTPTMTSFDESMRACLRAALSSMRCLGMPDATAAAMPPIASTCEQRPQKGESSTSSPQQADDRAERGRRATHGQGWTINGCIPRR
eukprot:2070788-Prymnesium_polylepis.2